MSSFRPLGALSNSMSVTKPYLYCVDVDRLDLVDRLLNRWHYLLLLGGFKDRWLDHSDYERGTAGPITSRHAARLAPFAHACERPARSVCKARDHPRRSCPTQARPGSLRDAISGATPIAASTCDDFTLPDEQAEPDETATPVEIESRSAAVCGRDARQREGARIRQARRACAEKIIGVRNSAAEAAAPERREGARAGPCPRRRAASAHRRRRRSRRSRRRSRCRPAGRAPARRRAAALSSMCIARPQRKGADALGAADLVGGEDQRVRIESCQRRQSMLPARLHGIADQHAAGGVRPARRPRAPAG